MSYNGTVRCSHCYQTGHNRRKCPDLTQSYLDGYERQMKRVAEYEAMTEEEAERQGTDRAWNLDYHTRKAEELRTNYIKRTKIDPATGNKVTNKAAKAERMKKVKCGYCGNRGHTRRVCQNAKNDYAIYAERTRQVRQEWHDQLKSMGIGVGTMIVRRDFRGYKSDGSYGSQTLTGLITEIQWDRIDAHREGRPLVVRSNAQLRGQKSDYYTPTLPDMQLGEIAQAETATAPDLTVLPSGKPPQMPAGWLTDIKPIKEVFSTDDERPWDYRWGDSDSWHVKLREDLGLPKCAYEA
jgi:hypothetical protein